MSERRIEGTLVLDGLIEGTVPDAPEAEDHLREWVTFAASQSLPFNLELEGGSFSILAEDRPIRADRLGPSPAEKIAEALTQLLKIFPAGAPSQVFSTLRSVEYLEGTEVQTVYTIGPGGTVETRERTVEAKTTAAPHELTRRERWRLIGIGLVVAAVVLAVSALFVPYGALLRRAFDTIVPLDVKELTVDAEAFKDYFIVEKKVATRTRRALVLTLKRREAFPLNESDLKRLLADAGESVSRRLTVEALARGYVRCEYFGRDGKFLTSAAARIAELRQKETIELELPLPRRGAPGRLVLTY